MTAHIARQPATAQGQATTCFTGIRQRIWDGVWTLLGEMPEWFNGLPLKGMAGSDIPTRVQIPLSPPTKTCKTLGFA